MTLNQQRKPNFLLGSQGETRAAAFLKQKGYLLIDQNIRLKQLEIDIIALDPATDELVFIEVKTRTKNFFGEPSNSINFRKQHALRKAAIAYLKDHPTPRDCRFDVITVLPSTVEHFENITW